MKIQVRKQRRINESEDKEFLVAYTNSLDVGYNYDDDGNNIIPITIAHINAPDGAKAFKRFMEYFCEYEDGEEFEYENGEPRSASELRAAIEEAANWFEQDVIYMVEQKEPHRVIYSLDRRYRSMDSLADELSKEAKEKDWEVVYETPSHIYI